MTSHRTLLRVVPVLAAVGLAGLLASCSATRTPRGTVGLQTLTPKEIDDVFAEHVGQVVVAEYWFTN